MTKTKQQKNIILGTIVYVVQNYWENTNAFFFCPNKMGHTSIALKHPWWTIPHHSSGRKVKAIMHVCVGCFSFCNILFLVFPNPLFIRGPLSTKLWRTFYFYLFISPLKDTWSFFLKPSFSLKSCFKTFSVLSLWTFLHGDLIWGQIKKKKLS